jgi:hypothetical protein
MLVAVVVECPVSSALVCATRQGGYGDSEEKEGQTRRCSVE